MAPKQPSKDSNKSWKEVNKLKKEQKKKFKEENLLKKLKNAEIKNAEEKKTTEEVKTAKMSTLSIAVPGSIMDNAQSAELRTYLAGQIARAACIFQVDEVIVFDDLSDLPNDKKAQIEDMDGLKMARRGCVQLARILQYLECPQYLRKYFFPIHNDLQYAGLINPLDAPSHLRQHHKFKYREGIVTNKPVKANRGSAVNVGLLQDVTIDRVLTAGMRVTVKILPTAENQGKKLRGVVVPPSEPRSETGIYWGYNVRLANSLSQIFSQSPYKKGYDLTIGTSDKGTSVDEFEPVKYHHLLVVFGGLQGLEPALEGDDALNFEEPSLLFDHYLNTLPSQGSRTIRTEEALLVSLAALRPKLIAKYPTVVFNGIDEHEITVPETQTHNLSRFD